MKNTLKLIHDKQIIQMDRTFEKLAQNARSDEYALLQSVRRDYPNYRVTTRHIKKNTATEHYKGLKYDFMRSYILWTLSKGDTRATLEEFDEMIFFSKCHSKRYSKIKKWFLDTYPEVKEYGMKTIPEEIQTVSMILPAAPIVSMQTDKQDV